MFKIDEVRPIPPSRQSYPWESLEAIGQSFLITEDHDAGYKFARQLVYAKNNSAKSKDSGIKYKAVKEPEGMRIYRVS